jgi:microcin C transport system permease protein
MNWPRLISDPLTRKRIRRFREKKRAWWSLWILVGLYAVSLGSELLCNDRPLYARFRGRSYFPTFRFYPEDTFRENGRKTRPDYLALRGDPVFRGDPANFMLFPPVACGPDTNIDPASLRAGERVTLTLKPVPRIGSLNVRDDMTIERSQACGSFFGVDDRAVAGLALTNYWAVPEALESAMRARLRNAACPAATFRLASLRAPQEFVEASLTGFEPRASPPPSVRLTL